MPDNIRNTAKLLARWGEAIRTIDAETKNRLFSQASARNSWFTPTSIETALRGITKFLDEDSLHNWLCQYPSPTPRTVGLIMAGNIPLVGFHDLLCTLASGHRAMIKLSSKDEVLLPFLLDLLYTVEPSSQSRVIITDRLANFDTVIATGSDNSSRYFEYYFGKYPHIIRRNRTSVAILIGDESNEELTALGSDVFTYFGMGCRNVSKIFVPEGFDLRQLLGAWELYHGVADHNKYRNNYDYQLAILLVNKKEHLDNGFVLMVESDKLTSPIAVVYYETYPSRTAMDQRISLVRDKIQCIVGRTDLCTVPFGHTQQPGLMDYADEVDTLAFLTSL
jgi:hypothetical protein